MSALPVGQHLVCIIHAEAKPNSKATGTFAALTIECVSGDHTGKTITDRLNLQNPNDKAVRIATEKLGQYLAALGLKGAALSDPQDVCFLPIIIDVVAGKDADRREVKSVKPCPQEWKAAADAACAQLRSRLPTPPAPPANAQASSAEAKSPNVIGLDEFMDDMGAPFYVVQRMFQAGSLYAFTAAWGAGKTALSVSLAIHVATGREWAGRRVEKSRVLYLCGENPDDVKLRVRKTAEVFGIGKDEVVGNIHFTRRPFAIDNKQELAAFVADAVATLGPNEKFGLVIVDTGPAHSEAEDENDNRQMHKLAMALRDLMRPLGNPATLVLMHPVKNASRDTLEPRGGGAFSGSVDGLIFGWRENPDDPIEVYHKTKFRGPGFPSLFFQLQAHAIAGMVDNFGDPVMTVVASPCTEQPQTQPRGPKLSKREASFMKMIAACRTMDPPRQEFSPSYSQFTHRVPTKVIADSVMRDMWAKTYGGDVDPDTPRRMFNAISRKLSEELNVIGQWSGYWWLVEWVDARPLTPLGFVAT